MAVIDTWNRKERRKARGKNLWKLSELVIWRPPKERNIALEIEVKGEFLFPKLSLHNNRRNGEPQAAFKYKYLQPQPQAEKKKKKTVRERRKASEKFSAFSGHVMKVQAFFPEPGFPGKSGSWSLARERKSAGGLRPAFRISPCLWSRLHSTRIHSPSPHPQHRINKLQLFAGHNFCFWFLYLLRVPSSKVYGLCSSLNLRKY